MAGLTDAKAVGSVQVPCRVKLSSLGYATGAAVSLLTHSLNMMGACFHTTSEQGITWLSAQTQPLHCTAQHVNARCAGPIVLSLSTCKGKADQDRGKIDASSLSFCLRLGPLPCRPGTWVVTVQPLMLASVQTIQVSSSPTKRCH